MHSSRMRTVRCSSRLPRGGGVCQGCLPEGGLPRGVSAVGGGGVCQGGWVVSARGGWGGVCPGGVSQHALGRGGVCPSACWHTPPSLWTEFLTHACENITFPQLNFTLSHLYYLPALFFAS